MRKMLRQLTFNIAYSLNYVESFCPDVNLLLVFCYRSDVNRAGCVFCNVDEKFNEFSTTVERDVDKVVECVYFPLSLIFFIMSSTISLRLASFFRLCSTLFTAYTIVE